MTDTVTERVALGEIPGVELIHVGTWQISTGEWTVTPSTQQAAVDALQCPAVREPVLKLGHTDPRFDGGAGHGWITGMRVTDDGNTLVGDFVGMPKWLVDVAASAYPDRSVEGHYGYECQLGHTHPFVLTGSRCSGSRRPVSAPSGRCGTSRRCTASPPPDSPPRTARDRARARHHRFPDRTGRGGREGAAWTRPRSARRSGLLPTPRTWSRRGPRRCRPPR